MKPIALAALASLFGCSSDPALPRYMQEGPKTEEDVQKIIAEIQKELGDSFTVERVDGIFFVASNDKKTLDRCKGTVHRMYEFLYADFLTKKPEKPLRVYLFKDKDSYEAYCKKAYDKPPSTPFGFYMSCERKMVMNIATGTGTLAHELVHPLLAEDFSDVPSWFNEGFASLYEQSRQNFEGKMEGLVNWRLPALQKAISKNEPVSLQALMSTSTSEFYGDKSGLHYAMARYFCLYLQEKGKLREFYATFLKGSKDDATGIATLEKVMGAKLADFEREWKKWVSALKYED